MVTRFGFRVVLAALLTLFGAATSASNLLYLIDGMLWAVLLVAWVYGRANLSGLKPETAFPEQIFQGAPFELGLTLRKVKGRASHQLTVAVPGQVAFIPLVRKGAARTLTLPYTFPRRGRNRVAGLWLESPFPFGLFRHRRKIAPATGLAFPHVFEIYGQRMSPAVREEQVSLPRRGVGDDFYGLRAYGEGEDARLINWKLTAKTGSPLVKEYAQQVGNRITITVDETAGPAAERHISEAASLAKYFIDAGADVRLQTPEATIDYGHGLLHLHLLLTTLALAGRGKDLRDAAVSLPKKRLDAFPARDKMPALAYFTTLIAFASLFLIEELNPLFLLAFSPVFLIGWLFDRTKKYPVPKTGLDVLAALFLLFFLFVDLPTSGALQAVCHLVLFIFLYLFFSPKSGRIPAQIFLAAFLAFVLTSGQALSLWYFPFFLAYFLAAGAWLLRNHDPEPAAAKPAWPGALALAGAGAVALAAVAFIVFPRPYSARMQQLLASTGLMRFPGSLRSFAGLSERVELGYLGPIHKNSARVMRVSIEGATAQSHPPFVRVRGTSFGVFDGKRWSKTRPEFNYVVDNRVFRARHAQAWMHRDRGVIYAPDYDPSRPVRTEEYVLSPLLNTNLVFGVGAITAIETSAPGAYFDSTDTAYFPSTYPEGIRYRILSQGDRPAFYRSIQNYDDLLTNKYLKLSMPSERLRRMAEEVTGEALDAEGKARALEAHFRNTFSYSLAAGYGRQGVETFLFESRSGNCEYFATAMVLLLRQLGIPARLIIGFLCAEWNAYGRFFDVRQSDAHAWVEAFLPERGWTAFDPTPADLTVRGRMSVFARVWSSVNQYFDSLQYRWYRYVIGYDSYTQGNFIFHIRLQVAKSLLTIFALVALAAAASALAWIWKPWRLWTLRTSRWPGRGRAADFFARVLDRLEGAGFHRPPDATAAEFSAALIRAHPEFKPMDRLANYHYEARYAGRRLSPLEEDHIRILTSRLEDGIRAVRRRRRSRLASGR
jgi:transglutaminase-like putative cysteine protease/uncharacterized protein (DUF58 family)